MVNGRIRADGPKGPRSPNRATFLGVLGIKLCPTAAGCIEVTLFFCAAHLTGDRSGRRPVVGNAAVRNEPRPAGEPPPTNAATRRARRAQLPPPTLTPYADDPGTARDGAISDESGACVLPVRRVRKQTPRLKGGRYERDAADMDGRPISMAFVFICEHIHQSRNPSQTS